ncbi:hypothetical protein GCM10010174_03390 [Kutzneria viridogrisea]|uniref:Uncharacterized protein n=1 Tax=Kutzneria viridogrisea TaxID=47990 RepID=A0ABR6BRY4_9PSEU|nr:hypothetical protein [Kutzneria viridogrisea]
MASDFIRNELAEYRHGPLLNPAVCTVLAPTREAITTALSVDGEQE